MEIENRQTQNSQQRVDGQKEKIRRVSLIDNVEESNRHRTKSFGPRRTNQQEKRHSFGATVGKELSRLFTVIMQTKFVM